MDEPLDALTQRFRDLHAQVMACFQRLHAAQSPAEKAEIADELSGLLELEMRLWTKAREHLRRELQRP